MEYIILDDLFGVKLWGENIFRRVYHHLSNNNYDPRRIPLLHKVRQLTDAQVAYLQGLTFENKALNTTKLSLLVGGQYSPKGSLYFNNMEKDMQTKMEDMGNSFIPHFETLLGTKLRLGDSNFRACILRYEGENAQFAMHYDTEHPDCFRTLMLYEGGIIPPFCYHDGKDVQKVHFQVKDGILFRGTTTHHGVYPSKDPTTKRYMVGFQYIKKRFRTSRATEFNQSIARILGSNDTFSIYTVCGLLSNGKVFAYGDAMDVPSWFGRIVTQYVCSTILCVLLLHDNGCETRFTGNRVHFVYGKNTFHGS